MYVKIPARKEEARMNLEKSKRDLRTDVVHEKCSRVTIQQEQEVTRTFRKHAQTADRIQIRGCSAEPEAKARTKKNHGEETAARIRSERLREKRKSLSCASTGEQDKDAHT